MCGKTKKDLTDSCGTLGSQDGRAVVSNPGPQWFPATFPVCLQNGTGTPVKKDSTKQK